ncbi:peptide chain release factor class I/class II, partial [Paraphysoderma sedebokerense]
KIDIKDEDLEEKFVRGSGKGGQKINKTSNCVDLKHIPTGIRVTCQATRSLADNRRIARKQLLLKLDLHYNGDLSKTAKKIQKIQRQKSKRRKRANEKYG